MESGQDLGGKTSDFPCFLCGECCSRYQVRVTMAEAKRISEKLGMEWESFLEHYTDSRWPGERSLLLNHRNGACIFLKRASGEHVAICSIHGFKPDSCIQWTPGPFRRECRDGLKRLWNLGINQEGDIIGEPGNIDRFNNFVSSLDDMLPEPQE
ncbi:MAG: YkgJ family cysteine cluster protein [Dehalococcoidales bacterium]|nr:YkgJ family cysteine cluster protein [Dehalococcoidales bacterium]MDD4230239.1 YkgJ family cysteine cluster protein [Dehalococcoidales bacterium]MDD4465484.1 YkgJ family cysteine cluster protein [Dehalococcoidales bacterium]